jgi:hypothetical protein
MCGISIGGWMMDRLRDSRLALALLLSVSAADAHHGWAAFDAKTTVTMKGTVTAFRFVSPHSVIEFDVVGENGKVEKWQGELTSAIRLKQKGWTAISVEPGAPITVIGNPAASGVRVMRINKVFGVDGKELNAEGGN